MAMEGSLKNNSGSHGRRRSKLFSLDPVVMTGGLDMGSLGSPTRTATPPLSPSASMSPLVRPPTHGGGPLSSHPTTPVDMPGAWVSTSDIPSQMGSQACIDTPPSSASPSLVGGAEPSHFDSFRTPLEPASATMKRRGSKGVRKLLSLSSLRNSFLGSGSRNNSLNAGTPAQQPSTTDDRSRSYLRSSSANYPQGIKRSASPLAPPSHHEGCDHPAASPLRKKKSAGWFRRKSQIFLFGQDGNLLVDDGEGGAKDNDQDEEMEDADESRPGSGQTAQPQEAPSSRHPDQSYEPPHRYQYYDRPVSHQPDSRPQSFHSRQPSDTFMSQERRKSVLLPALEAQGDGTFTGGSFGGEALFANIGR